MSDGECRLAAVTDERIDPLHGLHECPWCGERPGDVGYFDCVHEVINGLLRKEHDEVVALLARGCAPARRWHERMTTGPNRLILSPCTTADVVSVAGFAWAKRLEASGKGDTAVTVVTIGIAMLILFLVVNLLGRVA